MLTFNIAKMCHKCQGTKRSFSCRGKRGHGVTFADINHPGAEEENEDNKHRKYLVLELAHHSYIPRHLRY